MIQNNTRIFIALGSSLGDGETLFVSTKTYLEQHGIQVLKQSKNYTFPPYGGVATNDFTNAVWEIYLDESFAQRPYKKALQLLSILQQCENLHGRTRTIKWEDRTLDLDILVFENLSCNTKKLTLPHPEMHERDFVMTPLMEIL